MDEELNYARYNNQPYLSNLFNRTNYRLITNTTQLQAKLSDVNTCGRWTSLRVLMKNVSLGNFVKMFITNQHYHPDIWASALTYAFQY